jgi:colanic acid/amylovoran biosynthesis glycosyltransferase
MKVAFLVGRFPEISETFVLNQVIAAIQKGHEVSVFSLQGHPEQTDSVHDGVVEHRLSEKTFYPPERPKSKSMRWAKGVTLLARHAHLQSWRCLRTLSGARIGAEKGSSKLFYRSFPFLGNSHFDIIHCQFGFFGLQALQLRNAGLIKGPLVTTFRGGDISRFVQQEGEDVYDELFRHGEYFLTNCDFFRRRAIQLGCPEERIEVLRSGLDCERFPYQVRTAPKSEPTRIATTGRLVEKKGIEYAIRAVGQLRDAGYDVQFDIIGDGPLRAAFESLIAKLELDSMVHILGWKTHEQIREILAGCHLFVAPSVTAADGNQDAPVNTLKEAMASGLPVVATRHGGIPELVDHGVSGFLVPERDEDAIAERLKDLLDAPNDWSWMGKAGHERVSQDYDIQKLNDRLMSVYHMVAKGDHNLASSMAVATQAPAAASTKSQSVRV